MSSCIITDERIVSLGSSGAAFYIQIRDSACDSVDLLLASSYNVKLEKPSGVVIYAADVSIIETGGAYLLFTTTLAETDEVGYWIAEVELTIPGGYSGATSTFEYYVKEV